MESIIVAAPSDDDDMASNDDVMDMVSNNSQSPSLSSVNSAHGKREKEE